MDEIAIFVPNREELHLIYESSIKV
jgi:hypothetical protein